MRIGKAFSMFRAMVPSARGEQQTASPVRLNQLGYRPDDLKIACVVDAQGSFKVLRRQDGQCVLTGKVGLQRPDAASGERVAYADFSALKEPGLYFVRTELGDSASFRIAKDVYHEAAIAALRFFTLQRCGQALSVSEAGKYAHGECHMGVATVYGTDIPKHVRGGWHDAGDYGRYVSPAGKAVLDLLLAQRDYPQFFGDELLDEVRYELNWLLQMQDDKSGGVYHKVTSMSFAPLSANPDQDQAPMLLSPVSSTATGDFSGVCAYASLFFQKSDPGFAKTLLQAAKEAYAWLAAHPDAPGFANPPGVTTGQYGDEEDSDERALAAAALYLATGEPQYHDALRPLLGRSTGTGWADMGLYPVLMYLQAAEDPRDKAMYEAARSALIDKAEQLLRIAGGEGYRVCLRSEAYIWGSNMDVASHGMTLLLANRYAPNASFVKGAQDQLHYLLGRNANDISFLTHFGERSAQRPHHRPSIKAGDAMPGMLVGGPNSGLQDGIDCNRLCKLPPAKQYNDHWDAYASNEVAVYWNSPLVYLLAAFKD